MAASAFMLCSFNQVSATSAEPATEKITHNAPNILFIMTDDQAPWALGRSGNTQAITPHLDQLANEGLYLPNAYATTPVCSPSRAGLLTSQYGFETGIEDWINNRKQAKTLTGHQPKLGLPQTFETWPEILQKAGYKTGLIGKWHLGYLPKYHPNNHGYQHFVGFVGGGTTSVNPLLDVNGVQKKQQGLTVDILTDHAIDFITQHKQQVNQRFALSLHYRAPHYKFLPVAPEDEAPYLNMEIKLPHPDYPGLNTERATQLMREYLSSVKSIDRNVGRLLTTLKALDLDKNTVVIFTSDHGYNIAHNGMWHKGNGFWLLNENSKGTDNIPEGQRPNMYDNSLKVPTIVRWPEMIKANTENQSTLSNLDWFPTLVALANGKTSNRNIIRGNNYLPLFLDNTKVISTDYYAVYSTLHQSLTDMRMYSDGKYKLVRDFKNAERNEFYDLINDPDETTNLINTNIEELKTIITQFDLVIKEKMLETNDPVMNTKLP